MLKTFFFIPASNRRFYRALEKYNPDYFIFDLEDSISSVNVYKAINLLLTFPINNKEKIYIRLWDVKPELIEKHKLLFEKYKHILLPKVKSINQLDVFFTEVMRYYPLNKFKFIIIIESPEGITNLHAILKKYNDIIAGVGFGSHDYCNEIGASHTTENYSFARNLVLLNGKAFNKICIDIASTNISDEDFFISECKEAFNMGYDAKPVLHPWQYETINKISFYTNEEIEKAKALYKQFAGFLPNDISAIKSNGRIIEKPHVKRINNIIQYLIKQNTISL